MTAAKVVTKASTASETPQPPNTLRAAKSSWNRLSERRARPTKVRELTILGSPPCEAKHEFPAHFGKARHRRLMRNILYRCASPPDILLSRSETLNLSFGPGAFAEELRLGCADMCLAVSREVTFFGALHELGSCLAHRTACVIFGIVLVVCSECGNLSNHFFGRDSLG